MLVLCTVFTLNCYASTEEDLLIEYGLVSEKSETNITKESLEDLYVKYNSYKDIYNSKLTEERIAPILYSEYEKIEESADIEELTKREKDLEELLIAAVNSDADIETIFGIEDEYVKVRNKLSENTANLKNAYDKYMLASLIENEDSVTEDMFYQAKNSYDGSLKIYAQYLNQYDIGSISKLSYPITNSIIQTKYGVTTRGNSIIDHKGLDFYSKDKESVNSAFNGIVCKIGEAETLGKYVVVSHGFNVQTVYGHLDEISVNKHESIKQGEKIGTIGPDKYCHFALYLQKVNSDPSRLFK